MMLINRKIIAILELFEANVIVDERKVMELVNIKNMAKVQITFNVLFI